MSLLTPRIRKFENHFAAMANEPSSFEAVNCALLYVALALFAVKDILAECEIIWYYGPEYKR